MRYIVIPDTPNSVAIAPLENIVRDLLADQYSENNRVMIEYMAQSIWNVVFEAYTTRPADNQNARHT